MTTPVTQQIEEPPREPGEPLGWPERDGMSALNADELGQVRSFIVVQLACYGTPTGVAKMVKKRFNLKINRSTVAYYHPETAGTEIDRQWVRLFKKTRAAFERRIRDVPIGDLTYRMWKLQQLLDAEEARKNASGMRETLKQAAQEAGGSFTNKSELTGKDGAPLMPQSMIVRFVRPQPETGPGAATDAGGADASG